ncbi:Cytochrome P450 71D10 [Vitis vinifera]|uniref:Cytochrome P450 71D10 n=1 Tax=Vitis vinifera TaxID=29760 RepID=A0A438K0Q7_VITVI|nr:Cytochrome P450 71D10 [Vitis vinifera]
MEIHLPSSYAFFAFLLSMFIVFKIGKRSKSKISPAKLPPGPWKLPLIGNMHQLVGSLPHHTLKRLASKYGPFMHLQLGEVSALVVSSPEIARERVKSFQSIREAEVSKLIRSISLNAGSPINLSEKKFSLTYGITSRSAFGKKFKGQDAFVSAILEAVELSAGFCVADMYPSLKWLHYISGMKPKLEKVHQKIDRILNNIIDDHRKRKTTTKAGQPETQEDLVDVLLNLQEHGDLGIPLTDGNVKAVLLDIFSGGGETSSTAVVWAIAEMLKSPIVMEKAQAEVRRVFDGKWDIDETGLHELKYLNSVVKEILRLHPSVPVLLPRECRERCVINGYEIPENTKVIINAWAIAQDPDHWFEPNKFFPERFLDSSIDFKGTDFKYIPFGAGRRICPGILFAIPNVELPLANLLYHFDWKLPDGMKHEDLDMTEEFGLTIRRKEDLNLIPIPYDPFLVL